LQAILLSSKNLSILWMRATRDFVEAVDFYLLLEGRTGAISLKRSLSAFGLIGFGGG
jgi:hypothetical protein